LPSIHRTAQVDGTVGADVVVGAFCDVGPSVVLGDGVRLHQNVILTGNTHIGANTEIFPFASIGQPGQLKGHSGRAGKLTIGARCVLREYVSINVGSEKGDLLTKIGDDCLFMMGAHVAHDCTIGSNVVLVNYSGLAGHCVVGDHVTISGYSAVHPFVRIGESAYVGAQSAVESDVIPYGMVLGNRARLKGLNIIGLRRRGIANARIHALRAVYRSLFSEAGTLRGRVEDARAEVGHDPLAIQIFDFLQADSKRSICMPDLKDAAS
jgi:UDP-N-acetylglucosamine acyltransferase